MTKPNDEDGTGDPQAAWRKMRVRPGEGRAQKGATYMHAAEENVGNVGDREAAHHYTKGGDVDLGIAQAVLSKKPVEVAQATEAAQQQQVHTPPAISTEAVAGFRSDGVDGQVDLLDITRDVEALCSVIAARDVEPPLSIGLFGDWGSGKSFFIKEMKGQLARISGAARVAEQHALQEGRPLAHATRYCSHITQLEFNAWHYIETDLWASLTDGILDGLAQSLDEAKPSTAAERARLLALAAHSRDVLADAEQRKSSAQAKLAEHEEAYRIAKSRAFDVALDPRSIVREARELMVAAGGTLPGELERVGRTLETDAATVEAKAALLELRGIRGGLRALWLAIRAHRGRVALGVAAALAIAALGLIFGDQLGRLAAYLASAAISVLASVAALKPYLAKARSAVDQVKGIAEKYKAELDEKIQAAEQAAKARRTQLEAAVTAAATRVRETRLEVAKLEDQLLALRTDHQMARFLRERREADAYRKHLGVIAQARDDFQRLSSYMLDIRADAPQDGVPRIDRIVLYIDDLDRCSEAEVVKVLQAVHLLLAFKLFVVVVAVDSRWLLRSLQQHSRSFQPSADTDQGLSEEERLHWQATPLNYLEKIFQVPFTLRPMGHGGFGNLVEHLTSPLDGPGQAGEPPPAPQEPAIDVCPPHLVIEPWEQDFMKQFHELIPTPRAVKRFVNVYRLLRAQAGGEHRHDFCGDASGGEYRAVMLLLALLIGFPSEATDLMRDLVELKPTGDWWTWSKTRLPVLAAPDATPLEKERLDAIGDSLAALEARFAEQQITVPDCAVFAHWAPHVGRFSFHAGRLAAR